MKTTDAFITEFLSSHKSKLEHNLYGYIEKLTAPEQLKKAMLYSLEAGGKRIRPLLLFATIDAFNKKTEIGIPVACAIEMIHTYSLIHDDLPSMDNDDLRRGKPTNHKVFGEANAILAGDGLLTYCFQILAECTHSDVSPEAKLVLITELAKAAGPEGMVGGQVADIEAEGNILTIDQLESVHIHKTGKLLAFSIFAGGILSNASHEELKLLEEFAFHLGLAFQIRDDILDVEGDEAAIGKPVGSDTTNQKNTYPTLLSLNGAKEKLSYHIDQSMQVLSKLGGNVTVLEYICGLVASRNN